jgi:DNA-directed RNA polymerase I subunit RPA43
VHRTFNASIPRHHIPTEEWTFEHGPAENDPEFGWGRDVEVDADANPTPENKDESIADGTAAAADDPAKDAGNEDEGVDPWEEMGGRWLSTSGTPLGGETRAVEFTVVGMTVANEMLSLMGSIQPDPFDPRHVPEAGTGNLTRQDDEEEESTRTGRVQVVEMDDDDSAVGSDDGDVAFGRKEEMDEDNGEGEDQAATLGRLGKLEDKEKDKRKKDKQDKEKKRKAKEETEEGKERKKKKKAVKNE